MILKHASGIWYLNYPTRIFTSIATVWYVWIRTNLYLHSHLIYAPWCRLLFSGKDCMLTEILICLKRKKPAAFYFLRSASPHYRRFAPLRCAKVAAGRRVRERPFIRLQTREKKCLFPAICIQLKEKAGSFLLSAFAGAHYRRFATPTASQKSRAGSASQGTLLHKTALQRESNE